jgi:hypothetical protein
VAVQPPTSAGLKVPESVQVAGVAGRTFVAAYPD